MAVCAASGTYRLAPIVRFKTFAHASRPVRSAANTLGEPSACMSRFPYAAAIARPSCSSAMLSAPAVPAAASSAAAMSPIASSQPIGSHEPLAVRFIGSAMRSLAYVASPYA